MPSGVADRIIRTALALGQTALSEHDSKRVLAAYGIPVTREKLVSGLGEARAAAARLKYPVVLKACSAEAAHKTEKGLVAVNIANARALADAYRTLARRAGHDYDGGWLVQEMVGGAREVMIGMVRDARFGPSVMFGLGGVFTEVLQDVTFRVAPLRKRDALAMLRGIRAHGILGPVRGMKPVDLELMSRCLIAVGRIGLEHEAISEIDVNPLIIRGDRPVAVDALMVLGGAGGGGR